MTSKFEEIKQSVVVSLWFMMLTFPIMVIRVNPIEEVIQWRWHNMAFVGVGSFFLSLLWRFLLRRKELGGAAAEDAPEKKAFSQRLVEEPKIFVPALVIVGLVAALFPFVFSTYQTNIMTTALIYVVLGLGLNIVVGLAGLLDLGYVAFYAVGAYSYALLNYHFGVGFWVALPIGAMLAREEVADAFGPGAHATTFGGTPVITAAALETLRVLTEEGVIEKAAETGEYFQSKLLALQERRRSVVDVRGKGLMIGMALDRPGAPLVAACLDRGFLINCIQENVLRFAPPLVIERAAVDALVDCLDELLA